jgi:hypothetical protein
MLPYFKFQYAALSIIRICHGYKQRLLQEAGVSIGDAPPAFVATPRSYLEQHCRKL